MSAALALGWLWPEGDDMEQLNCYTFFSLGTIYQNCFLMALQPIKNWRQHLDNLHRVLTGLLEGGGEARFKFDESAEAAKALIAVAEEFLDVQKADPDVILAPEAVARFNLSLWRFDQALSLELGRAPIFFVTPKSVYDTRKLINDAAAAFDSFRDKLPVEAIADTNAAGRCLAFTLPTAAGFHIARATEAVIKGYMQKLNCQPPKESQRNWGKYADLLEEKNADAKIVHHIRQLKDLHRNPMVHPDDTLTMPEALALWSMCLSLIQAMVV